MKRVELIKAGSGCRHGDAYITCFFWLGWVSGIPNKASANAWSMPNEVLNPNGRWASDRPTFEL